MLNSIEKDLHAFADPGSSVLVDQSGAQWFQDGEEMNIRFFSRPGSDLPGVEFRGERWPYLAFLASPWMADLQRLATFTARLYSWSGHYIETDAQLGTETPDEASPVTATELLLRRSSEDLPFMSTRVLFVKGEAGAGKTVALRRLTSLQAESFKLEDLRPIFFYVNAQGRALSRLEDAMAKELDDLRARFSYRAISPLTRRGLIIPIIDGFDELLGSGGYDDAFSSLAAFLETLDGRGVLIASARSAFFDYRDFYENAKRFAGGSLKYSAETLDILPWNIEQVEEYVELYGRSTPLGGNNLLSKFRQFYDNLDERNRRLLEKPFYVAKVSQLLSEGFAINTGAALMGQLVDALLSREVGKLLDRDQRPLLSQEGHREFLASLAEEMWWQESRRLDVGTVQTIAELIAESHRLPPSVARALVEKVSSYAFLTSQVTDGRHLSFEHEVFYGYFLAERLINLMQEGGGNLRRFLARSVVDPSLVEEAVVLFGSDVERCSEAVDKICGVMRPMVSDALARENAGVLVGAMIQSAGSLREGITLSNIIMRRVDLRNIQLNAVRFENCDLYEVDISDSQIINSSFEKTILRDIKIDVNSTRLDGCRLHVENQVLGLIVFSRDIESGTLRTYSTSLIAQYLHRIGAIVVDAEKPEEVKYSPRIVRRINLVEKIARRGMTQYYLREGDQENRAIFNDPEWPLVERLLREYKLIEDVFIERSGPRQPLLRLAIPPTALRRGEDLDDASIADNIHEFWMSLVQSDK